MSDDYGCVDLKKLFYLLNNPSVEMQEMGSGASDYDLSQVGAEKVFKAMVNIMFYRLENPDE